MHYVCNNFKEVKYVEFVVQGVLPDPVIYIYKAECLILIFSKCKFSENVTKIILPDLKAFSKSNKWEFLT